MLSGAQSTLRRCFLSGDSITIDTNAKMSSSWTWSNLSLMNCNRYVVTGGEFKNAGGEET